MAWSEEGTVDAHYTDTVLLLAMRAEAGSSEEYVIVQESIHSEPYGWVLPENDSDRRDFVGQFLIWTLQASCSDEWSALENLGILAATCECQGTVFDAI